MIQYIDTLCPHTYSVIFILLLGPTKVEIISLNIAKPFTVQANPKFFLQCFFKGVY